MNLQNPRLDRLVNEASGLPEYAGWSSIDIKSNILDVVSSKDNGRNLRLSSALSALPSYSAWAPEEVSENLFDVVSSLPEEPIVDLPDYGAFKPETLAVEQPVAQGDYQPQPGDIKVDFNAQYPLKEQPITAQSDVPLPEYAPARVLGVTTRKALPEEFTPPETTQGDVLWAGAKTAARGFADIGKFPIDVSSQVAGGIAEKLRLLGWDDPEATATKMSKNYARYSESLAKAGKTIEEAYTPTPEEQQAIKDAGIAGTTVMAAGQLAAFLPQVVAMGGEAQAAKLIGSFGRKFGAEGLTAAAPMIEKKAPGLVKRVLSNGIPMGELGFVQGEAQATEDHWKNALKQGLISLGQGAAIGVAGPSRILQGAVGGAVPAVTGGTPEDIITGVGLGLAMPAGKKRPVMKTSEKPLVAGEPVGPSFAQADAEANVGKAYTDKITAEQDVKVEDIKYNRGINRRGKIKELYGDVRPTKSQVKKDLGISREKAGQLINEIYGKAEPNAKSVGKPVEEAGPQEGDVGGEGRRLRLWNADEGKEGRDVRPVPEEMMGEPVPRMQPPEGPTKPAAAEAPAQPPPERRVDFQKRKRIAELTEEEAKAELQYDALTGLKSKRAWEDEAPRPVQAIADVDGLKWANDNLGYEAGDELLKAVSSSLKEAGVDAYRVGGDEIRFHADDAKSVDKAMKKVYTLLENKTIEATRPDGTVVKWKGLGVSYGYGTAESLSPAGVEKARTLSVEKLHEHKLTREQQGLRAGRAEEPPGISRIPPKGNEDQGRVVPLKKPDTAEDFPEAKQANEAGSVLVPFGGESKPDAKNGVAVARQDTRNQIKNVFIDLFKSGGHMPESAVKEYEKSQGWLREQGSKLEYALSDFNRAKKQAFKGTKVSSKNEFDIDMVLRGEKPTESFPEALQKPVKAMRDHVDALSNEFIRRGIITGDLVAKFKDGIGFYLNRSYQVTTDAKWYKKVPRETVNKATAYLRQAFTKSYIEDKAALESRSDKLLGEKADLQTKIGAEFDPSAKSALEGKLLKVETDLNKAAEELKTIRDATEGEIQGALEELLFKHAKEKPGSAFEALGKVGAKNLSILMKKGDIPVEIRALWGENRRADVNYVNSVTKMASLIANHEFLTSVKALGLKEGWLKEKPFADDKASYSEQIASKDSKTLDPLNGLYTTQEIKNAFETQFSDATLPGYLQAYMKIVAASRYSKTVLSPITHVRNVSGNAIIAIANGHFNVLHMGTALKDVYADFMKSAAPEQRLRLNYLKKIGLIGESVNIGELRAVIKDAMGGDIDAFLGSGSSAKIRAIFKGTEKLYSLEDDLWKIFAFENEKARYSKALPELKGEALDRYVTEIVRNTYPTYSKIPKIGQILRRFPFTGTFVSFPAEIIRTGIGIGRQIKSELWSDNKAIKVIGAQRLAGTMLAMATPLLVGEGIRQIASRIWPPGNDDEISPVSQKEENDMRPLVQPWSANSELMPIAKTKDGKLFYIDAGYTDPYSYAKKPLIAMLRGGDFNENLFAAIGEMYAPFFGEDIVTSKIFDLKRNRTKSGSIVYNKNGTPAEIAGDVIDHFWTGVEPGVITQARRVTKAFGGELDKRGQPYSGATELASTLTGLRVSTLDIPKSLEFKARQYKKSMSELGMYQRSKNKKDFTSQTKLNDDLARAVVAARNLGLTDEQITSSLRTGGVSSIAAETIISGKGNALINHVTAPDFKPSIADAKEIWRESGSPGSWRLFYRQYQKATLRAKDPALRDIYGMKDEEDRDEAIDRYLDAKSVKENRGSIKHSLKRDNRIFNEFLRTAEGGAR
ncbi:MAG: diguanylate cyclase [Deltaproteobacteria bacterium]|nr:MAG: diguanylate cyclase [Deltaproteobacteria bacterium]